VIGELSSLPKWGETELRSLTLAELLERGWRNVVQALKMPDVTSSTGGGDDARAYAIAQLAKLVQACEGLDRIARADLDRLVG